MKKIVSNGYIVALSSRHGTDISDSEYQSISEKIHSASTAPSGYRYQLRENLTWELCEMPMAQEDADPELSAEEALATIMGGTV